MRQQKMALICVLLAVLLHGGLAFSRDLDEVQKEILIRLTDGVNLVPAELDTALRAEIPALKNSVVELLTNSPLLKVTRAFVELNAGDSIAINQFGDTILKPRLKNYYKLIFPDTLSRNDIFDTLKRLPDVIDAVKNGERRASCYDTLNDLLYLAQWNLFADSNGIDVQGAWCYTMGKPTTIIGIVDAEGVRHSHPDLSPRVFGDSYVDGTHGTAVAGIAAATADNEVCIAGVCPGARIYAGNYGNDIESVVAKLIAAVDVGADVINGSFGGYQYLGAERRACAYAYKMNRTSVFSKGNDASSDNHYPSDYGQGIISVGSHDYNGEYSSFSNIGNGIDVCAPGEYIYTIRDDGVCHIGFAGTSYAAPHVAGLAALLFSYDSTLYNDDIENIINITAVDIDEGMASPGYDDYTGHGRINARAAFEILQPPNFLAHSTSPGGTEHSHTGELVMLFLDVPGLNDGYYLAFRYDVRKTINFPHEYLTVPHVWGTGTVSRGFSDEYPNCGMNYTDVIDGSITTAGCQLRTFVYHVYAIYPDEIGWFPCTVNNVLFAYSSLGEYKVQPSPNLSATRHYDHQSIKLCIEDPNPSEDGWIIQRKAAGSGVWSTIDTISNNPEPYCYYEDYYPIGSETYTYRVKPFTINQQNVAYSDEVTITARPRSPENLIAYATDCSGSIPANPSCDNSIPKTGVLKSSSYEPPVDPNDPEGNNPIVLGNDITVSWSVPDSQKYSIVAYYVKKCVPPGTSGPYWNTATDTCLYICPNETQSAFNIYVYAIASNGDTSLAVKRGVQTGQVNMCPGNITKDLDGNTIIEPEWVELHQNEPNPFNMTTKITFSLPFSCHVNLTIYDILGRKMRSLADMYFEAGVYDILWDGTGDNGEELSSGVYFYRLDAEEFRRTMKMIMLK